MRRTYCESCARMPIAVKCTGAYPDWSARGKVFPPAISARLWFAKSTPGFCGRLCGGRGEEVFASCPLRVWKLWVRGKACPPAQEFGKRGGVFRILMPTAPTRIKLSPALPVLKPVSFTGRDPRALG